MIGRIRGTLLEQEPDRVVVETAGGVGYEVIVAPRLMMELPAAGEQVTLFVHTQVREDAITLYGFADRTDRAVFRLVLSVQGIGPKLAMALVGTTDPEALAAAIAREDVPALTRVPGLGKKTASRLVLELKDKLGKLLLAQGRDFADTANASLRPVSAEPPAVEDARAALSALGYNAREITRAMKTVEPKPDDSVQSLLRRSLKVLSPA
ncbi:MAG: Holliday junction branch migration protein RuvA [Deltaproteobacteria bacterium]|nr:Holliday junction branch migration protein RuvA [Deltaproteobacteria bacterium]